MFSGYLGGKYFPGGCDYVVTQTPKTALIRLPVSENVSIRSIGCCTILNQLLWFRSIALAMSAFQDTGCNHALIHGCQVD
jgi:hypothetical protein